MTGVTDAVRCILIVGASRGLGLGLAQAFAKQGWRVTAAVRDPAGAPEALRAAAEVQACDIDAADQVAALHRALDGRAFDVIFVVAGVLTTWGGLDGKADEALSVLRTNAVSPALFAEAFVDRLAPGGQMAFMTSAVGSHAENRQGGLDAYRASKAALNMLAQCFALRHADIAVTLMHPGWVKTAMGGSGADIEVETSVRGMARVIQSRRGETGIQFRAHDGRAVAW